MEDFRNGNTGVKPLNVFCSSGLKNNYALFVAFVHPFVARHSCKSSHAVHKPPKNKTPDAAKPQSPGKDETQSQASLHPMVVDRLGL